MKRYDILYHYGDTDENEVMETKEFASAKEAERYAEYLNRHMDSKDALAGDYYFEQEKPYEELTVKEKAAIAAELLDNGINEYSDTCKRLDDGRYRYQSEAEGTDETKTPEELLTYFMEFYGEDLLKEEYASQE